MADVKKTIEGLKGNGFDVLYFDNPEEAVGAVIKEVGGEAVGMGGSATLKELHMADALAASGCAVYSHAITPADKDPDIYKKAQYCGVYMASANAITEDGLLVNIDGRGNRVSSMAHGPKKLIIVAGTNKLVANLDEAVKRIKGEAAGKNARRLGKKTPCAVDLVCRNCKSPDRLCRSLLITEGVPMGAEKLLVVLIGKDLGF